MRIDIKRMKDRPIKIKTKGVNSFMVFSVILIMFALIATLTSKMWLPDDRNLKELNNNTEMVFNNKQIKVDDFYVDYELAYGEISFKVTQDVRSKDDLKFVLMLNGGVEYPVNSYKIIKGSILPTTDESKFFQEYLVQFSIPDDFYYISLMITQDTIKTQEFQMDYRNFKEKKLVEKEENFLISLDDLNIKIVQKESKVNELSEEIKGYSGSIDTMKSDIVALETKMKVITDENTLKEKQITLEGLKTGLVDNEKKLKESQDKLEKEKSILVELQNEKDIQK